MVSGPVPTFRVLGAFSARAGLVNHAVTKPGDAVADRLRAAVVAGGRELRPRAVRPAVPPRVDRLGAAGGASIGRGRRGAGRRRSASPRNRSAIDDCGRVSQDLERDARRRAGAGRRARPRVHARGVVAGTRSAAAGRAGLPAVRGPAGEDRDDASRSTASRTSRAGWRASRTATVLLDGGPPHASGAARGDPARAVGRGVLEGVELVKRSERLWQPLNFSK